MADIGTEAAPTPMPCDIQAEMGVLGSIMLAPGCIDLVRQRINAASFYRLVHQDIYRAQCSLLDEKQALDLLLLRDRLRQEGKLEAVGGAVYLTELMQATPTSANVEFYVEIVRDCAIRRLVGERLGALRHRALSGDQNMEAVLNGLHELVNNVDDTSASELSVEDLLAEAERQMEARARGEQVGIPLGLRPLDRLVGGLEGGDLMVLAGFSSTGKTSFAVQMLADMAVRRRIPCAFFSVEMAGHDIVTCAIRCLAGVDYTSQLKGTFSASNFEKWQKWSKEVKDAPLWIELSALTTDQILARAGSLVRQEDVKVVFVDYIQLVAQNSARSSDMRVEVAAVGSALKRLARRSNVVVVGLSQITRLESGRVRLRDADELTHAADVVLLLRPESGYGLGRDSEPDVVDRLVQVGKQRLGRQGQVYLRYDKPKNQFSGRPRDSEEGEEEPVAQEPASPGWSQRQSRLTPGERDEDVPF